MSNFRWGILGTGGIAQAFARDLQLLEGHTFAAVGSRTIDSANSFAANFSGCIPYGSYQDLVDSDVDAIYVATPHTFHFEHAQLALNAGKPVLCEKPFTINSAQAQTLIDLASEKNLALMEAIWTRFLPHIQVVRDIVHSGVLGNIQTLTADHGQYLPRDLHPRLWEPGLGGGALLDLGIYPITFADIVLGTPASITARAELTDDGVDLQSSMIFQYPNGAHALLSCTMANRTPNTAVVAGNLARLEVDGFFFAPTSMRVITRDGAVTEYQSSYEGIGLREEAVEFARIVNVGAIESPLAPHKKTLEIMHLMDEIRVQIGVKYPNE